MTIYLDFDGTVVSHRYPEIGEYNKGCFEVLKKLQEAGHSVILNTSRIDFRNGTIDEALFYLKKNNHQLLHSIIDHTSSKLQPPEWSWESILLFEVMFIDDISKGIPLKKDENSTVFEMVNWQQLDKEFVENGIYELVSK
jgi:predicted mannosyl-3-phosphoglycerate phosphatase (HAD superfamily)